MAHPDVLTDGVYDILSKDTKSLYEKVYVKVHLLNRLRAADKKLQLHRQTHIPYVKQLELQAKELQKKKLQQLELQQRRLAQMKRQKNGLGLKRFAKQELRETLGQETHKEDEKVLQEALKEEKRVIQEALKEEKRVIQEKLRREEKLQLETDKKEVEQNQQPDILKSQIDSDELEALTLRDQGKYAHEYSLKMRKMTWNLKEN
jgi:hypothetical protein